MNPSFSKCLLDAKWKLDVNKIGYIAKIIQCHQSHQTQKMETRKRLKRNTITGLKVHIYISVQEKRFIRGWKSQIVTHKMPTRKDFS